MQKILGSKFGTVCLIMALTAMLFVMARALSQKYHIDKQISQLRARADQIRGQNQDLSDLVNYLQTDQYKEKAARQQLNLKKDGEMVVALPQTDEGEVSSAVVTAKQQSNAQKWYDYFFLNQ